jgi:hypothetical protein
MQLGMPITTLRRRDLHMNTSAAISPHAHGAIDANAEARHQPIAPGQSVNVRAAGLAIIVSAIASIVAVALDTAASGHDALSIMQSMIKIQQSHQLVHVVAMACLGGLMFGYTAFSQRLGLHRAPVMAALIAYGLGTVLMFLGTIIDGFVSADTALMFVGQAPDAIKAGFWMIQTMSGVVLIDIAKVSWVLQSIAVLLWAFALLQERGLKRAIGVLGLIVGALPAITVFVVGSAMTDMVVVGILLMQAVWNIAAATLLLIDKQGKQNAHPLSA